LGTNLVASLFGLLMSLVGTFFVGCFAAYLWDNRYNRWTRFFVLVTLVGLASNAKITHQFSSRYVFVFLPFMLLSLAPALRLTWHLPVRVAAGACASLISVASYLRYPT